VTAGGRRGRGAAPMSPESLPAVDRDPAGLRFVAQLPEPGRFWVRFAPRGWVGPEHPWLDLAGLRLGRNGGRSARGRTASAEGAAAPVLERGVAPAAERVAVAEPVLEPYAERVLEPLAERVPESLAELSREPELAVGQVAELGQGAESARLPLPSLMTWPRFDDVVYLPPVPRRLAAARDTLARQVLAAGAPCLVQLAPGDETSLADGCGAVFVFDLLAPLLAGDRELLDTLAMVPPWAAAAVWPLVPGITDDPDRWERGCQRLAAAGLGCVQAVVPALAPGDRRRLAQGLDETAFAALFHRQPPAERGFARVAHRHGLAPFLPRPLPRPPLPGAENRRVAGLLALAAELWLRLGRQVEQAQALLRAARWLDATGYDVGALHREGNLAVVTALDALARREVAESIDAGEPALLAELLREYLEAPAEPASRPAAQEAIDEEP
jgi:hypothetical protein